MNLSVRRALRLLVTGSLILGGLLALSIGVATGTFSAAPAWVLVAIAVWGVSLAVLVARYGWSRRTWTIPSAALIASFLFCVGWAQFAPVGYAMLSGLTPYIAATAAVGVWTRERWSWPVALALMASLGPTILSLAPFPDPFLYSVWGLFLSSALALFAIHEDFFEST